MVEVDQQVNGAEGTEVEAKAASVPQSAGEGVEKASTGGDDSEFDLSNKKKKKKKPVDMSGLDEEVSTNQQKGEEKKEEKKVEGTEGEGFDFGKLKKKKKKTKKNRLGIEPEDGPEGVQEQGQEEVSTSKKYPWSGSDREYKYEELLDRFYAILKENNPELGGHRKKASFPIPKVQRDGTKKSVHTNFSDTAQVLKRGQDHLMQFILTELGTSGNLDGQKRLVVKGRFQANQFEAVLRKYITEYVLCQSCKSADTLLHRDSETRLMYLRCQQCGASKSVAAIKAGFMARTTKRQHH